MRHLIAIATVLMALGAVSARAQKPEPPTATQVNLKNIESHLRAHQKYPATRAQLIAACYDLKDFSDAEKKWFLGALPDRTYHSADEVLAALRGER